MGMLLGSDGVVIGIDHIPELQALATQNIREDKPELLDSGRVELIGMFIIKLICYFN